MAHTDHIPVMRKYRSRCDVRAVTWMMEEFRLGRAYDEAFRRLAQS